MRIGILIVFAVLVLAGCNNPVGVEESATTMKTDYIGEDIVVEHDTVIPAIVFVRHKFAKYDSDVSIDVYNFSYQKHPGIVYHTPATYDTLDTVFAFLGDSLKVRTGVMQYIGDFRTNKYKGVADTIFVITNNRMEIYCNEYGEVVFKEAK